MYKFIPGLANLSYLDEIEARLTKELDMLSFQGEFDGAEGPVESKFTIFPKLS